VAENEHRTTPPTSRRRRILVVDDSPDSADALAVLFQMMGHEVFIAFSGREGLALLREQRPDIALLDVGLPDMDGHEVARRAREDAALRGVRLVALTGWAGDEERRRSQDAGFDRHLVKPADREALEALLSEL
jgi:CheY-like chemotaxis protein